MNKKLKIQKNGKKKTKIIYAKIIYGTMVVFTHDYYLNKICQ